MEKIKDTIETVIKDLMLKKSGAGDDGPQGWLRKVLTKRELGHIKFQYFRKGVLGLITDSSGWLYSLNLKKDALLEKFKKCSQEIKDVRFSIGDLK
ncbi:MAG: DciA family protein [Candidatus Omnitrophota bacterium]